MNENLGRKLEIYFFSIILEVIELKISELHVSEFKMTPFVVFFLDRGTYAWTTFSKLHV